jgi:2-polyprenyl-6-methoxyphenol hydroxylase-like FAD-dependent oxidoreductase
MSSDPIIIVGAGIGGLTAALALLRRGIDVRVYEQAPELGEIGAGVQISANGTRVLHALGLEAPLAACAVQAQSKEVRHWKTGRTWKLFDLGAVSVERYGAPYLFIHRGDLHRLLAEAVRREQPSAIQLGATCTGVEQSADAVTLRLADGRSPRGRLLVGADGVHSAVRASVFGAGRPQFTGCMAWRGAIPAARLPKGVPMAGTNWLGPGRHIVHYPLRRGEVLNFVGLVERDDWQVESWTARGTPEECRADFVGWHEDVRRIVDAIDVAYKWALMVREPMQRWSRGRVTLLGDACHPTLPDLAQGACMAIEDAFVLARCLTVCGEDYAQAFERYEAARIPRTTRIVMGSAAAKNRFHDRRLADDTTADRYIDEEWSPERIEERYDWLFAYNALNVEI